MEPPTLVGGTGGQRDAAQAGGDQTETLSRVMVDIASDLDLDATLKRVVTAAMELTGARFGALGVRGPDDTLTSFVHGGIEGDQRPRVAIIPVAGESSVYYSAGLGRCASMI